jgi:hypothetical protein
MPTAARAALLQGLEGEVRGRRLTRAEIDAAEFDRTAPETLKATLY